MRGQFQHSIRAELGSAIDELSNAQQTANAFALANDTGIIHPDEISRSIKGASAAIAAGHNRGIAQALAGAEDTGQAYLYRFKGSIHTTSREIICLPIFHPSSSAGTTNTIAIAGDYWIAPVTTTTEGPTFNSYEWDVTFRHANMGAEGDDAAVMLGFCLLNPTTGALTPTVYGTIYMRKYVSSVILYDPYRL